MADDLQISDYGRTSIERSQGFSPMSPAPRELQEAEQEKSAFDRGVERLSQIDQAGESQPMPIQYNKINADGTRTDEKSDERLSVTPERAAADLSDYRRGISEAEQASRDIELAAEIDALKAAQPQVQQPQQPPAEPVALDQQQQPQEIPPAPPGYENDELVKAFQREPKLLEAVNTLSWQHDQKVAAAEQRAAQYAEAVNQQYARELDANARAAIATVFAAYPELQGLSQAELPAAIQVISKQDPNRALQLQNHIKSVQLLSAQAQQAQAQQQYQQQQRATAQFSSWAQQQDNAFEAATKSDPPQRQTAIRNEAHRMLREYGMTDQEINYNWQTNPMLRSQAAQMILRDAALYRMQQRTAQGIKPAAVPPVKVQTPGPRGTIATEDDSDLRSLSQRLNQSHSAKDAAALLSARRSRSR